MFHSIMPLSQYMCTLLILDKIDFCSSGMWHTCTCILCDEVCGTIERCEIMYFGRTASGGNFKVPNFSSQLP